MTARFVCFYCLEPLKKKDSDFTEEWLIAYPRQEGIQRIFHNRCVPNRVGPDNPLQAAIQRTKQAIADARRLTESEYGVFRSIVEIALTEQRQ